MPGILYVVATPIGNLEDVTLRALRILREVSLVAAEDTRRTARLLQHYSISTPTTSLHEHNEHARAPYLVGRMLAGESIALVSDAGTPGLSDPGALLVRAAREAGVSIQPVPGASAVTALISASGLASPEFLFAGFAPSRASHRKSWLERLASLRVPVVVYEAPHRIEAFLIDAGAAFPGAIVTIGRELTKMHEDLVERPIAQWIESPPVAQGEFVILISPADRPSSDRATSPSDTEVTLVFGQTTNENPALTRREVIRETGRRLGLKPGEVFDALERHKESGG